MRRDGPTNLRMEVNRCLEHRSGNRKVAYEFTGCLAHVEVTEHKDTGAVSRIIGILTHNDACNSAELKRMPAIPLHEHVYEIALEQLRQGARFVNR